MTQTLVSYALAQNIGNTGLLFFVLAWLLRYLSSDDAPFWWVAVVIFLGSFGLTAFVIGALLQIWSA